MNRATAALLHAARGVHLDAKHEDLFLLQTSLQLQKRDGNVKADQPRSNLESRASMRPNVSTTLGVDTLEMLQ